MDGLLTVAYCIAIVLIMWYINRTGFMGDTSKALQGLLDEVDSDVQARITGAVDEQMGKVREELAQMHDAVRTGTEYLTVQVGDITTKVEGLRHRQLNDLLTVAAQGLPVLLVGMAGSGKTHAAQQVADALDRKFYAMSVGAQTSKSDIIGYMHAGGDYVPTMFRHAYEHGGVFLMDEIDAGNANVLIQVNAALSNGYCAFPDGMVKRHDQFVFVASANTFGNGANRQYVGRNQLDAATLDRFAIIDWHVDDTLEKQLAGTSDAGKRWHQAMVKVRQKVEADGLRVLVTPRATLRGATLLAAGVHHEQVAEQAVLNLFPADKKRDFKTLISNVMSGRDTKQINSGGDKKSSSANTRITVDPASIKYTGIADDMLRGGMDGYLKGRDWR